MTKIPYDFLVDKINPTATEVQVRFQYCHHVFDKDANKGDRPTEDGQEHPPQGDDAPPLAKFEARMNYFRRFIADLAVPRLKEVFRLNAAKSIGRAYPDCKTLDDYLYEYRYGKYGPEKRAMVHKLCDGMWGRESIKIIEKQIMKILKVEYEDILLKDGNKEWVQPRTRRHAGSIAKMINRMRQTLIVDRFR